MSIELVSKVKCFEGYQKVYQHFSKETQCLMKFSVYEPTNIEGPLDVIYFLSGIRYDEQSFIQETGFQKYASEHGFLVVGPDTSPRGSDIPDHDEFFMGKSAGAYLDATEAPWNINYRMYSYVTKELYQLIKANFCTSGNTGIMGHSMGGHGAIMCGLRNPVQYQSISALAPITNPASTQWAKTEAWIHYLGDKQEEWNKYDSCEIAKIYDGPVREILIDQGTEDELLESVLMPENFREAVAKNPDKLKLDLRYQEGFEHYQYFVKTFIGDHFKHHVRILRNQMDSTNL